MESVLRNTLTALILAALLAAAMFAGQAAAPGGPERAEARHGVTCWVSRSGRYVIKKDGALTCRAARFLTLVYVRSGRRPSGWSCLRNLGNVVFLCRHPSGRHNYWVERR